MSLERRQSVSFLDDCTERPVFTFRLSLWSAIISSIFLNPTCSTIFEGALAALFVYAITGGWKFLYIMIRTSPRDITAAYRYIKLGLFIIKGMRKNSTVATYFTEHVKEQPDKPCFIYEDQIWTYKKVDELSNKIANVFNKAGYKRGDIIALVMESCPEYVCIWLGLAKIGVCTALINYNLKQKPLVHCITVAEAKALIYSKQFIEAIQDVQDLLTQDLNHYCFGEFDQSAINAQPLTQLLNQSPSSPPPSVYCKQKDKVVYVYTSGTTGLPKPAIIHNARYCFAPAAMRFILNMRLDDVFYTPLPLYHTAGGLLGVGQAIIFGSTVVIRNKFSASKYWEDCIKYQCTVAQYIGEICRYLLAVPEKPTDTQHNVRLAFGNGLRPQIWKQFTDRFQVPEVGEIYGSTEGNANIINMDNTPNAIGFVSRTASWVYPVSLIKIDMDTNQPLRDRNGLCIHCKPGEPGEFVGKISKSNPIRDFSGYANKGATEKKIIRDVFKKGDSAFASGDLLVMDEFGYVYFKDRLGDTFRWKGENVSTAEVEGAVIDTIGLRECTVYGVEVPGCEGRAGMAAILDPDGTLDLKNLADGVNKSLPVYARPMFVRIVMEIDMTGTYKMKKTELQKQGIDPRQVKKDKLYVMDMRKGCYELLDEEKHEKICNGSFKL